MAQMMRLGEIIQLKKGLYVLAPEFGGQFNLNEISNVLYGPSYISLEYVLSKYFLIPERVDEVTCVTSKRNKFYQTPVGNFSYRYIKNEAYSAGVHLIEDEHARYFMASKEKSLCDKIALSHNIRTMTELKELVFDNLRIDRDELNNLDFDELSLIRNSYNLNRINLLFRLLVKLKQ